MKTLEIAKDIVFLCNKNGYKFNNTKIQKLLYLFVGFCLINGIEEIYDIDENPKLWPYGPVFPVNPSIPVGPVCPVEPVGPVDPVGPV
jgi:uncharacterized phage-associated protein